MAIIASWLSGRLLAFLAAAVAGCAALPGSSRPVLPAAEIPSAEYEVRALVALAPTKPADGELLAAIIYTPRAGPPVELWEATYPSGGGGWLLQRSLGNGNGTEHRKLVKSVAHYQTVSLPGRDGAPVGYALLHKSVAGARVLDRDGGLLLIVSASNFIDPNYVAPDSIGGR